MVKELKVSEPPAGLSWEEESQMYYELAVEGIPLPEKLEKVLESRLNIFLGDRDPAALRAEKEWDSYALWRAAHPEAEDLTPGERLKLCFG